MSEGGSYPGAVLRRDFLNVSDLFWSNSEADGYGVHKEQAMENTMILSCVKNYTDLCMNLDKGISSRVNTKRSHGVLPSDLERVEDGIDVLCMAYMHAKRVSNPVIQGDIEKSILSLSCFYEKKVAEAYFSASDLVFDADDIADNKALLKQLVQCRDNLQKLHAAWPVEEYASNMQLFETKVDFYSRQIGILGQAVPEKRLSFSNLLPRNFVSYTRCA